jgi:tetratricopeptide (TPR) repeat protein
VPKEAPEPVRIPDHVWFDPAVLAACRRRDANALLRLAHKYGNTNERIAYWTEIDPGEISKRITGKTTGPIRTLERWERLADGLGLPDPARRTVGLASAADTQDLSIAVPRFSPPAPEAATGDLDDRLEQAYRGVRFMTDPIRPAAAVEHLEGATEGAAHLAVTAPPELMLASLTNDFETAQELLRSALPERIRSRAVRSAAMLAVLLAEELMILGRIRQSMEWFGAAAELATAAGDTGVLSDAFTLQSRLPLYFGEVAESVEIARQAQDLAVSDSQLAAALGPMVEALALAQLGDERNSLDALDAARRSYETQGDGPDNDSIFGFSRRRFLFYESRVLLDTGNLGAAWIAQDEALGLYPDEGNGDVTILQLDRARLLVNQGDAHGGCAHAVRTLTQLPEERQAPLFVKRAWRVLASIPRGDRRSPAAAELGELLRSKGAPA